jgi:ApbE superfamily uncharacterized protein (UPF0280 family)
MSSYEARTYRKRVRARGLVSFRVSVKETDLLVSADRDLQEEARALVLDLRHQLETYIRDDPGFATSLSPHGEDPYAPPLVKEMIRATREVGVGPMGSVAGAIAQHVALGLLEITPQVIVENGGDIFLKARRRVTVALYAGRSPLSGKIGLLIPVRQMPLGVCSSSGTVGHSLSMGTADAVCLVSGSAALADGAATAVGNRIRQPADLEAAGEWARAIEGILGGVVILKDRMIVWGDVELVDL